MSKPPSNPAPTSRDTPAPASHEDMDLAGCVDQLLVGIDSTSASLSEQVAQQPPTESIDPETAASAGDLLKQVDQLLEEVAEASGPSASPANDPTTVAPDAIETASVDSSEIDSAPVFADTPATAGTELNPAAPSIAQTTTQPAPLRQPQAATPRAAETPRHTETIASLDDEMSRLADAMLETTAVSSANPLPAPSPLMRSEPVASATGTAPEEPARAPRPSLFLSVGARIKPLVIAILAPLSAPLANQPASIRQSIGWIALGSFFFASVLWAVVLTRKPAELIHEEGAFDFAEGTPPKLPVAQPDAHATAAHGGGHEKAKDAGHGDGHAKAPDPHAAKGKSAKKPPRQNKAAAKAKKDAAASSGHH
jgi:hypothetical protein